MEFDQFTVLLLVARSDAPKLTEPEEGAIQDAHLAHLAKLHEDGLLLAAGPLSGPPDRRLRGLCLFRVKPEAARSLEESDPAVRAGWFSVEAIPWAVPQGAMHFSGTRFP